VTTSKPQEGSFVRDAFNEHRSRLFRYLRRRLANEDDAQEIAQETFLRLLRVPRSDLVEDPQAYLYRVARNLVYERSCKTLPAHRWADDSELDELEALQELPDAAVDRLALAERVTGFLEELPPQSRAIFSLFWQRGLSQQEIAEQVGLSKSMVQKTLAQSIAYCRKRLPSPRFAALERRSP
jgi:RNA polymerase sigma-19 factor, ECF subfamily